MKSKSFRRIVQTMKSSRVRYSAIFAALVLILVFSAVQASGPARPPHPPMPPQNDGMWGMQMPSWGMSMPKWPPWHPQPWHPRPWYPPQPVPKIKIVAVFEDLIVFFETENFPENKNFMVTMGEMYTRGVDGIEIGVFNSGDGSPQLIGAFIPPELFGLDRISIRAQSDDEYPYYAFNWFYNTTAIAPEYTALEGFTAGDIKGQLKSSEGLIELDSLETPLSEAKTVAEVPLAEEPAVEKSAEEPPAETESEAGVGGAGELTGVVWQWTGFSDPVQGDLTIDMPEQYTVEFMPEGLVAVKADCNNGSGTYITDADGSIDIAIGIVTAAACAPESLSDQFLQYLGEVAVYSFDEDGILILDLAVDTGTMTFAAGEAEALAEGEETEVPAEEEAVNVTGTVTYRERIALPDDAVVTVQIYNAQLADATEVLGEQIIETGGQQVPIPFEVTYNPEDINENIMYSVSARIEDGAGNLLFISDTVTPVITNGNPTEDVEIMTIQVAEGEAEAPAEEEAETPDEATTLTGVVWNWTEFSDPVQGTVAIEDPSLYTVEFMEDGTVDIKADCNNGSGSFVADEDGAIDITVGAVTLALCEEDSLSDQFIQYLDAAVIYFFEEGDLFMDLPVDSGTLRFAAAAAAEAGATAKLASIAMLPVAGGGGGEEEVDENPVPSFTICVVGKDEFVSIVGENFPADQTFAVKMGVAQTYMPMPKHPMPPKPMPYQGPMKPPMNQPGWGQPMGHPGGMWMKPAPKVWIPYYEAGTLETGAGGDVKETFEIPAELTGAYKISIMMRTDHQFPYISYNWFFNNDADVCNGENNNG
jgi:uncharacterized lipoprotein YbaY